MDKTFDEKGNEVKLSADSFKLVQRDVKIHDTKFETSTTTFFKDALKRFCKNKSSIVGAVIIGILILLSIIVPIFSPHDVKTEDASVAKLGPKLFNVTENTTGTFWNGCEIKTGLIWDFEAEAPVGCKKEGVVRILKSEDTVINGSNPNAGGGTFVVMADVKKVIWMHCYGLFDVNTADNYQVEFVMDAMEGTYKNCTLGQYRILLTYNNSTNKNANDYGNYIVLKDYSQDYSTFTINLSDALAEKSLEEAKNCRIRLELQPTDAQGNFTYFGVETITITCESEDEAVLANLDTISLSDANGVKNTVKNPATGGFDDDYWRNTGISEAAKLVVRKVDIIYDKYQVALGSTQKNVAKSVMQSYIDKGYCEYDFSVGPSSFKVLNAKKCPITAVYGQSTTVLDDMEITYVDCQVILYKEKGYTNMPKFIFGTDASGYDLWTKCFSCLLRSLALAVVSSAICFAFGLCWGAISGYFGGAVDLMMERFCEILGGVPWIVIMTLVLLILEDVPIIVRLGIAMCLTGWMGTAGITRTQFYRFKGREYILASRTLGATDMRLIFKHILPNAMGTIITASVLRIPGVIFSEASLAYLGLLKGTNSFGTILSGNQQFLSTYPMLILFPSIIISLLMISFNLFGNGLRDAFNPSLKGSD